jgi:hypothetical protein
MSKGKIVEICLEMLYIREKAKTIIAIKKSISSPLIQIKYYYITNSKKNKHNPYNLRKKSEADTMHSAG